MNTTLLPAIRSNIGDWVFYVTTLSLKNISSLIKRPDEIHSRKGLSTWIQREIIETHADEISKYLQENEQRFLGSLIVGVYGGNPNWSPLNVNYTDNHVEVEEEQKKNIEGKLGLLHLSGQEKLFAIDGQHRVEGIKKLTQEPDINPEILDEEICAIFVSHDNSSKEGKQRTRRLFTTVNKKAKPISTAAKIALDEDDGFAIVTRNIIDSYWLFEDKRKHISYTSSGAIPSSDTKTITSVVGLYELTKALYTAKTPNKTKFAKNRPSDEDLNKYTKFFTKYLDYLINHCPEYKTVLIDNQKDANYFRENENHFLFRPVGQKAFANAVRILLQRGEQLEEAIDCLLKVNLKIDSKDWHHILWDPINGTMIIKNQGIAESHLLSLASKEPRNAASRNKLNEFLKSREEETT